MPEKDKGVVDFGGPDPEYKAKIDAAKQKVMQQVLPPIPRLDQPPPNAKAAQASMAAAKRVLTPEQVAQLKSEGKFVPGIGSGYTVNQPGFNGGQDEPQPEYVNPPRPPGAGLRPETVEQLKAVAEANKTEEEVKDIVNEVDNLDGEYETDEYGRRVRSLMTNSKRREAIESRCEPMAIEDLIVNGEVRQRVPIIPGKLEPVFRSVSGEEDLFIKRLMSKERGTDQYIIDRFSLMNLVAGVHGMNGKVFPSHLDKDNSPNEDLFNAKMRVLSRYPFTLLADLSNNYVWFNRRVQKLLVFDNIKGF